MFSEQLLLQAENGSMDAILDIANSYYKGANTCIDDKKAFYWYKKAYEKDNKNTKAINGLADCYRRGKAVKKDLSKCLELCQKSAQLNDVYGITMIGHFYFDGRVVKVDVDKAIEYYEKSSGLNSLEAIDSLYDAYCEKYDENTANIKYIEFLRMLAANQNPFAMVRLYDAYTEEQIAPKDENTALYYLNQAVAMNCPRAITMLGVSYATGDIPLIGTDEQKSKELIDKAAKMNDEWALNILAHSYNYGIDGYPQDIIKAKEYYERCIEIGELFYADSLCELGLELCDSRNDIYNLNRGINLLDKAAELEEPIAANYLGHIYEDGFLLPQNIDKAIEYYTIAARQDYSKAQCSLGGLLVDGLYGVTKDEKLAIDLFEKSAQQGNFEAMQDLGICAYDGKGMPADKERARMLFENCAKEGMAQSQFNFALMNQHGEGGSVNHKAAEYWYNKAIEQGVDVLTNDAKLNFAVMYTDDKEYQKAFPLWTDFAKAGNADAQCALGLFYSNGWAVPQNKNIAQYWLGEAVKNGCPDAEELLKSLDFSDSISVNDEPERYIPADISVYKKIVISSTIFFIIGFLLVMIVSQDFLISLIASYLISVIPLSIMRLKGLKMSGGQAVMTAAVGSLANGNNGCTFALAFMLGRWIMNYAISVLTSPYWYIKSIVMLIKTYSK